MKEKSSNVLYFTVGVLAVAVGVLAYSFLSDRESTLPERLTTDRQQLDTNVGDREITGSFEDQTNSEGIE